MPAVVPAPEPSSLVDAARVQAIADELGGDADSRIMAEWIVDGKPSLDVSHMHFERFGSGANDRQFVEQGAVKVYGTYYDLRELTH